MSTERKTERNARIRFVCRRITNLILIQFRKVNVYIKWWQNIQLLFNRIWIENWWSRHGRIHFEKRFNNLQCWCPFTLTAIKIKIKRKKRKHIFNITFYPPFARKNYAHLCGRSLWLLNIITHYCIRKQTHLGLLTAQDVSLQHRSKCCCYQYCFCCCCCCFSAHIVIHTGTCKWDHFFLQMFRFIERFI